MVKRSYDDGCAAAHALDLIGERWALLVVRELLFGPKRFTDLRTGLPGASPNVLAQRLRELEGEGVVRRHRLPPPAAARVYELTQWGTELEPVIMALGRWGGRSRSLPRDAAMSVDSIMLALKTSFRPELARGFTADLVLELHDDTFRVQVSPHRIRIDRGANGHRLATIRSGPATLDDVIWNGRPVDDAIGAGDLSITGDRQVVERFVGLFPLPEPAPVASTAGA